MMTMSSLTFKTELGNVLTDDVVTELPEPRQLRRAVRAHVQDVPHILIGSLETAEPEEEIKY